MNLDFDFIIEDVDYVIKKSYYKNAKFTVPTHPTYRIIYVLSGSSMLSLEKEDVVINKDDVLILPPSRSYHAKVISKDEYEFCVISFKSSSKIPLPPKTNVSAHTSIIKDYFLLAHKRWTCKIPGYMLHIKSLLYAIVFRMVSEIGRMNSSNDFVEQSIRYMENNYNKKLTIGILSEQIGYSSSYYIGAFTKATGMSPIKMLNSIRIQRAKELLKTNMFSVAEVADKCGFESMYYFSNTFKKFTGVSPGKYLK